jgi:hypothetical protein
MRHRLKLTANLVTNVALLCTVGVAGVALTAAPASAQIAAALGKPLPSPDLPVGTVSVRIVAGSAASPVVGTDVTLVVNDTPRVARTDSAGRATFGGLPAGANVVAHVNDQDKTDHPSDAFTLPADSGVRLMITTKPWQAGAGGGAPFAGGGGAGMPAPRQLSGEPRPEQGDAAGMITVRVSYNDFQDTPEGVPVTLIGYASDDTVSYQVTNTDKAGRVQFTKLDRSGGTSYFALTQLPRNGAVDRLMSLPIVLESQMGVRLVLSSEKRSSTAPVIDDLSKAEPQLDVVPAGKVRVELQGAADAATTIKLFDAETKKELATGKATATEADPTRVQSEDQFTADPKMPAGMLTVQLGGGAGQAVEPLKGISVRVIPADSPDDANGPAAVTGADGAAQLAVPGHGPQKVVYTINGRSLVSRSLDLGDAGGKLLIRANWEATGRLQALLDVEAAPHRVVYAEATNRNLPYRSLPFQLFEGAGSKITVYIYPRVLFRFLLQSFVDDQQFAVQGRFEVMNSSWTPYRAGPDGLMIPLPKGFKGGVVYDPDQPEVAVAAGEGFRVVRPIPPGGRKFHGGFSLPVEDGNVAWAFDLPMGSFQSEIDIKQTPGMKVSTVGNVKAETHTVAQGTFSVLAPITIMKNQSMHMTIEGLPSLPAWRTRIPQVIGLVVVAVMLAGVGFALLRPRPTGPASGAAASGARRQKLLDELVALERSGGSPKRREQLLDELEELWT